MGSRTPIVTEHVARRKGETVIAITGRVTATLVLEARGKQPGNLFPAHEMTLGCQLQGRLLVRTKDMARGPDNMDQCTTNRGFSCSRLGLPNSMLVLEMTMVGTRLPGAHQEKSHLPPPVTSSALGFEPLPSASSAVSHMQLPPLEEECCPCPRLTHTQAWPHPLHQPQGCHYICTLAQHSPRPFLFHPPGHRPGLQGPPDAHLAG